MCSSTRGVVWFLGLAFAAAWLWFFVLWLMRSSFISLTSPVGQLLMMPGGFAPAVAAIIVRKWVTREGFADAGLGIRLRTWPFFLIAWAYPLLVMGGVILLAGGF